MVRPHLEYGNVIWCPRLKRQSIEIEKVQRRATKLIPEICDLSYEDRLKYLRLPSLKTRRIRGDLIQTFKIFNNIDNIDKACFFEPALTNITRNSSDKIQIQYSNSNIRKYSFSQRVAPIWNKLTLNIKQAPSTNSFKNLIDKHKTYIDVMYDFDGQQ